MRILFLTSTYPFPPHSGYQLRCYNILTRLAKRHEVFLLSFSRDAVPHTFETILEPYLIGQRTILGAHTNVRAALLGLVKTTPFHVYTHWDQRFLAEFKDVIGRFSFDVVYANFMYFTPYVRYLDNDVVRVLDQHNVDHEVWKRMATSESSWLRRLYAYQNYLKTNFYERRAYRAYDLIISVSERDRMETSRIVESASHIVVVPNGVDYEAYQREHLPQRCSKRILFTGSDSARNIKAISYFINRIFPMVRASIPDATFVIAGKISKKSLGKLLDQPGVQYVGPVADIVPEFLRSGIFVAPFVLGGGTKLKVLEAMASGCAVVTTTVGCQGLSVVNGEHVLIANDDKAFADAVIRLIKDNSLRSKLTQRAKHLVRSRYNWDDIVRNLNDILEAKVAEIRGGRVSV